MSIRFCQQIKGFAEGCGHLAVVPIAVRKYKVEQTAFLPRRLAFEQGLGVPGKFENLHAFFYVGLLGGLVLRYVRQAAALIFAPGAGHSVEEIPTNPAVELVDVHRINPGLQAVIFGAQPPYRLFVFAFFVCPAGVQGLAYPVEHLFVEVELAEQVRKLLLQHFLANILAAAGRRLALAFIGVARAVVIDILLLLYLCDDRTAAFLADDQS